MPANIRSVSRRGADSTMISDPTIAFASPPPSELGGGVDAVERGDIDA
jgi:hypothetical protein